jgi:protein ImuB
MQSCAADRLACADLPAFPLQLVMGRYPEWRGLPVAVVSRETPQGEVLIASRLARKQGVFPGLRCAAAIGLSPELRTRAVSQAEIDEAKAGVIETLWAFSPRVEADQGNSGAFWLNASGLERLYPSLEVWGNEIQGALGRIGFKAVVVIGFSRFGTFALARGKGPSVLILKTPEEERAAARAVPLEHLALPPWITEELGKLGKQTVGDLLHLPADGLLERYGPLVYRLRSLASGELWDPLTPVRYEEPLAMSCMLDQPESDAIRLTFFVKGLLSALLSHVAGRHAALAELEIELRLDQGERVVEQLRPARPTLDERQLIDLVRLRLEKTALASGVVEIRIRAGTVPAAVEQRQLFAKRPRRDLEAADRALARLRAEFGPRAVVRLRIQSGHLPEAQFSCEPLEHTVLPKPVRRGRRTLVRRVWTQPIPLNVHPVRKAESFFLNGISGGPFRDLRGPYILSGGWWHREIHREYYFAENRAGKILWVYWDKKRGKWFLHGEVE